MLPLVGGCVGGMVDGPIDKITHVLIIFEKVKKKTSLKFKRK